ncbi:unnamed protein product, partial [Gongylonema pulchrum]|uniref:DNA-directed RNA polymerase n=1 Tax=Gongylonema pulchrum TaxID=637853 RepID=A0A183E6R7_9BILA
MVEQSLQREKGYLMNTSNRGFISKDCSSSHSWMEKMAKQHEKLRPTAELLYTPRKCDSTSRILGPRDYDSIMITFAPLPGELPPKMLPRIMGPLLIGDCISTDILELFLLFDYRDVINVFVLLSYAISGKIRRMGESDDCINRLATHDGILMLNPIPKYKIEYEV